jgi:hypothetical protein
MLLKLYPKVHRRYTSLPILGPVLRCIRDVAPQAGLRDRLRA